MTDRLAVVVAANRHPLPLPVLRWLGSRYGIERVALVGVSRSTWRALPANATARSTLHRDLRASIQPVRPDLLVVVGQADAEDQPLWDEQDRLLRVGQLLRAWATGTPVVEFWLGDAWSTGELTDGSDLTTPPARA